MPAQNFQSILIYVNLYQHAKKSGYFIDLFWRYFRLKNPAIWLAENILAHISNCVGTQQIIWIFITEQIQYKSITKFFNKFKKTVFDPLLVHCPIFGTKKNYQKICFCYTISYWFLALCQNLGKTNHTIPWKCPDGRTVERADGRTEGKTNEQTLPTTTGG